MTTALLASLAMAGQLAAQAVDGPWDVRFAQAVRVNRDGSVEIQRWGNAELVLSSAGDSVTGTWTSSVAEDVTWSLSGVVDGQTIRLQAMESDSDDPELRQIERIVWEGTISGDTIEGRMHYRFRGASREPAWRPFTGRRRERESRDQRPAPG